MLWGFSYVLAINKQAMSVILTFCFFYPFQGETFPIATVQPVVDPVTTRWNHIVGQDELLERDDIIISINMNDSLKSLKMQIKFKKVKREPISIFYDWLFFQSTLGKGKRREEQQFSLVFNPGPNQPWNQRSHLGKMETFHLTVLKKECFLMPEYEGYAYIKMK